MKNALFALLVSLPLLSLSQNFYGEVDKKYGFKSLVFDTKADSTFRTIKAVKLKGSDAGHTSYNVIDPRYLKVGECTLSSVTVDAYNNAISSIMLTTKQNGFDCMKDVLTELFGNPFQSNKYIERYAWIGEKATIMIEEKTGHVGLIYMISTNGSKAREAYKKSKAKDSSSDF